MLSPADRALVDRDAAIPGLALALDSHAVAAWLRETATVAVRDVRARYLRYKPGSSLLVAYDVFTDVAPSPVPVHVRALSTAIGGGADVKLAKAVSRPFTSSPLGFSRMLRPAAAAVLTAFPNDEDVRGLATVADDAQRQALLRRMLPKQPWLGEASLTRLAYKPGRRFVGRLELAGRTRAVVRAYVPGALPDAHGVVSGPSLCVPRVLGRRPWRSLLVTEWIDGTPLQAQLQAGEGIAGARRLGDTLAQLHGQRGRGVPARPEGYDHRALTASVDWLCALLPGQTARLRALATRIGAAAPTGAAVGTLHGDLHAGQVIVRRDGLGLVDFDQICVGPVVADLGAFVASLIADAVCGAHTRTVADEAADAFVDAYASAAGVLPAGVEALAAMHLVRRAGQAFRLRQDDWPARLVATLDHAEALLDLAPWTPRRTATRPADSARVDDAGLPTLADALDTARVTAALGAQQEGWAQAGHVVQARLVRHKAGRRALIQYDLVGVPPCPGQLVTCVGKVRAKGVDVRTADLMHRLWRGPFASDSVHGASVPQTLAVLPSLGLWLQARIAGRDATTLVFTHEGVEVMARAGEALHRLHASGIDVPRRHGRAEEVAVLDRRLGDLAVRMPQRAAQVRRVAHACAQQLWSLVEQSDVLLHRDFHPDHVLWADRRVHLIDFDLAAMGEPGLDVGNMVAHLIELGVRHTGDPDHLARSIDAFVTAYGALAAPDVAVWTTVALARLAALSLDLPGRAHTTTWLLELCERRVERKSLPARARRAMPEIALEVSR